MHVADSPAVGLLAPSMLQVRCRPLGEARDPLGRDERSIQNRLSADYVVDGLFREFVDRLLDGLDGSDLGASFDSDDLPTLDGYLKTLIHHHLIRFDWVRDGERLLSISPLVPRFHWRQPEPAARLSSFAVLRRGSDGWELESPTASCRVQNLSSKVVAALVSDDEPQDEFGRALLSLMSQAGLTETASEGRERETWEFHDRLFHHHSTRHHPFEPFGGSYPFRDERPYPRRPTRTAESGLIALRAPDAELHQTGFVRVLADRRSTRLHGPRRVTLDQLAELLGLAFRVSETATSADAQGPAKQVQTYRKAFPSAGGIHELQLFVIVNECDGLSRGIYRYDDVGHTLAPLPKTSPHAGLPIQTAAHYWDNPSQLPQILLLLTSRLDQLAWKYERIAYRLSLINAGAAAQTLALTAEYLGLACCMLGTINGLLFEFLSSFGEIDGIPILKIAIGAPFDSDPADQ
jgi:SagB-type dehydrogenase family enzyme